MIALQEKITHKPAFSAGRERWRNRPFGDPERLKEIEVRAAVACRSCAWMSLVLPTSLSLIHI